MAKDRTAKPFPDSEEGWAELQRNSLPAERTERTVAMKGAAGEMNVAPSELREMTFEQLQAAFGAVDSTEAIGTDQYGPILEDKGQLVRKPFMIVHWEFYDGDFGKFVSMWILTADNSRYIVNDGSTGIFAQLQALTESSGLNSMLACRHGLRVSEYEYEGKDGISRPAKTYYLDTKL